MGRAPAPRRARRRGPAARGGGPRPRPPRGGLDGRRRRRGRSRTARAPSTCSARAASSSWAPPSSTTRPTTSSTGRRGARTSSRTSRIRCPCTGGRSSTASARSADGWIVRSSWLFGLDRAQLRAHDAPARRGARRGPRRRRPAGLPDLRRAIWPRRPARSSRSPTVSTTSPRTATAPGPTSPRRSSRRRVSPAGSSGSRPRSSAAPPRGPRTPSCAASGPARRGYRTGARGSRPASPGSAPASIPDRAGTRHRRLGFIGSHFVAQARRRRRRGRRPRQADLRGQPGEPGRRLRTSLHVGDIASPADVERAAAGCEAIVNFAAETHVDRSLLGAAEFIQTDVHGTYVLLERRPLGRRPARPGLDRRGLRGRVAGESSTESDPLRPSSPYAASKAGGDLLVLAHVRTFGVDAVDHARLEHVRAEPVPGEADPAVRHERARRRAAAASTATAARRATGSTSDDHCAAIELVLRAGEPGEVYNVGGDCERENLDVARTDRRAHRRLARPLRHVEDRPGHDRRYSLDSRKAPRARLAARADVRGRASPRRSSGTGTNRDWWEPLKSGEYLDVLPSASTRRTAGAGSRPRVGSRRPAHSRIPNALALPSRPWYPGSNASIMRRLLILARARARPAVPGSGCR